MAIADPVLRKEMHAKITNSKLLYPVLAHPQANLGSERNYFGQGSIITAGCVLTVDVVLGEFAIINLNSTLGHDVKVGSYSTVMPGCNISGNVIIQERSMIGTGAQIVQNISLGSGCRVGAGAVVLKSVKENTTVVGVPAHEVKK
jgi:sugar O-acyltransferase (sialic acid O-acetyltransferase NeuD family)